MFCLIQRGRIARPPQGSLFVWNAVGFSCPSCCHQKPQNPKSSYSKHQVVIFKIPQAYSQSPRTAGRAEGKEHQKILSNFDTSEDSLPICNSHIKTPDQNE